MAFLRSIQNDTPPNWMWPRDSDGRLRKVVRRLSFRLYQWSRLYRVLIYFGSKFGNLRRHLLLLIVVVVTLVLAGLTVNGLVVAYRMWRIPAWVLESVPGTEVAARIFAYRSAQAGVLGVIVQAAGGIALVVGLYFTWRGLIASQEGQTTERFLRCVDQLANDRIDIRVGAIQGLERVASERRSELVPTFRLLCAFASGRTSTFTSEERDRLPLDFRSALETVSRMQEQNESLGLEQIELRCADFTKTNLSGCNFERFNLSQATFDGADLSGASLRLATLDGATFYRANLKEADLKGVRLSDAAGADLTSANLAGATCCGDLQSANFDQANCEFCRFEAANLRGASFNGTLCYGANFSDVHIQGVDFSQTRFLPDDYFIWHKKDLKTVMPGKSIIEANREYNNTPKGPTVTYLGRRPVLR